ncbi:MAG: HDOD domain-containing protein [Planctomycetota bacterium]|jgi:HD-like signal output (HDOD) protein
MTPASGATTASSAPDSSRVELILGQLEQLPTLPPVAIRILQATTSPDTNAADIVSLIETDQALTAKILSLVRRSDMGVSREVTTLSRAVVLLGFAAVRNAVLSIQIYETFAASQPGSAPGFDRSGFWKHSLAVACAAQSIARRGEGKVPPDEAFVCGLLHDLGKAALEACLPKAYARVVRDLRPCGPRD